MKPVGCSEFLILQQMWGYQPCILEFDLALTADYYSATRLATEMTRVEVDHRCEHIVPRLTSRCEGLLEVHGYKDQYWGSSLERDSFDDDDGNHTTVTVYQHEPWRKVSYLHRKVKDFLKTASVRARLERSTSRVAEFNPDLSLMLSFITALKRF
jgi:hypothetical protein